MPFEDDPGDRANQSGGQEWGVLTIGSDVCSDEAVVDPGLQLTDDPVRPQIRYFDFQSVGPDVKPGIEANFEGLSPYCSRVVTIDAHASDLADIFEA